jgi:hypothetical protein
LRTASKPGSAWTRSNTGGRPVAAAIAIAPRTATTIRRAGRRSSSAAAASMSGSAAT